MAASETNADQRIALLATRADGVVSWEELIDAGVTRHQIAGRVRKGILLPEYPGVYRVGHRAPNIRATYVAAVKACGDGAALCGLAGAHHLVIIRRPPSLPEVTAPTKRRVKGIVTRRHLDVRTMVHEGIRVTTPAETLVQIAGRISEQALAHACHEAGVIYGTTPHTLEPVLTRRPNAKGASKLRAIMSGEVKVSLSALERRFLELLHEPGLPLPDHTNRPVGTKRVDCRWVRLKLTVELDSYRFHNSRWSWEQDRKREREAHARGDAFRRYTWHDVFEDPEPMLADLRGLLI